MERCPSTASDGRRCLCPEGHGGRHLVGRVADHATLLRVAEAWGFGGQAAWRAVASASTGAREGGHPLTLDDFADLCEVVLETTRAAIEKGNRDRFERNPT